MDGQVCLLYFKLQPSEMMNFPGSQVHPLSIHTHTQTENVPAKVYCTCTKLHGSISKQTVILVFNHCENARFCVCLSVHPSHTYINSQRKDCYSGNPLHLRTRIQQTESEVFCDIATCEPPARYRRLDGTDIHEKPTKCTVGRETPLIVFNQSPVRFRSADSFSIGLKQSREK